LEEISLLEVSSLDEPLVQRGLMEKDTQWLSEMAYKVRDMIKHSISTKTKK
jgi:hypothetical protein